MVLPRTGRPSFVGQSLLVTGEFARVAPMCYTARDMAQRSTTPTGQLTLTGIPSRGELDAAASERVDRMLAACLERLQAQIDAHPRPNYSTEKPSYLASLVA